MPKRLRDWLEQIQENHPDTIELGLERVTAVWQRMGCPRPARRIITVAGTNGKGSTVAGIEAGLIHLGRKVGCYTSPHILHYRERIRINGADADESAIVAGFEAVEAAQGDTRLTYFEFATLAAIATMDRARLDVAVMEVGLGGRLDAVNVIDADIGVITAIGIDHQEYLGSDRETIGREKAGIMRDGQVVVCSDREPPLSIFDVAEALSARLIRLGADFEVTRGNETPDSAPWTYFYGDESVGFPVRDSAAHLADNLAGALTAVIMAEPRARDRLGELAVVVAQSRTRGRLELVSTRPDVILDVGHNPLAAGAVSEFLRREGRERCRVVIAMLSDKDAESCGRLLDDRVAHWSCAGLEGPRGQSGAQLAARIRSVVKNDHVESFNTVSEALDSALRISASSDTVLVLGSFLTVAEAMDYFDRST